MAKGHSRLATICLVSETAKKKVGRENATYEYLSPNTFSKKTPKAIGPKATAIGIACSNVRPATFENARAPHASPIAPASTPKRPKVNVK